MTIRPIHPFLATFLITLAACDGGAGGGGDTGGGGTTGEGGGGGGGGGAPACEAHAPRVFGCVVPAGPAPEPSTAPVSLATAGTVTAVRDPDPAEPCAASGTNPYQIGSAAPEVMIDLVDANGATVTVGLAVPGFTADDVAVGDSLDINLASEHEMWGGQVAHLSVQRGGQLVAAVGSSDPIGLTIGEGQSECYRETVSCGHEDFEVTVEAPDGSSVSIPNGETAEVGELSVTNDRYFHNYDTSGACNFGLAVEYLIGVAPAAAP